MTPQTELTYTGARATPELVGRDEIRQKITTVICNDSGSAIIYITGPGGVGKTRLLQHLLNAVKSSENLLVATRLIDLYHTRNRSVGGLIESVLDVIGPPGDLIKSEPEDIDVDEKLKGLALAEQEGPSTAELFERRKELTESLLEVINQFTRNKRLVIALDTAERLFAANDLAQEKLELTDQRPAVLDWLLNDYLPRIQNTVILLAGRLEPLNLVSELKQTTQSAAQQFVHIDLSGLDEEEALQYFAAVIEQAKESKEHVDAKGAEAIDRLTTEQRKAIFFALHDGGPVPRIRPILLALTLDHLIVVGHPLAELSLSLDKARILSDAARRGIEQKLGKALVRILHDYRRPTDEIILTLGWLRKGADIKLLAKISELPEAEIELAVEQIKDLSFIKIRPSDQRIFLHDEIYDLLYRDGLDGISPDESGRIFHIIRNHYEELISQARHQIAELYRPQMDTHMEVIPEPALIRASRTRLQDAIVEDLYYRLRWDAQKAFQNYYLYTEEAVVSNDMLLGAMLRAEIFGFLAEHDPKEVAKEVQGLQRADVVADSAVRWVEWLWGQEKYDDALKCADKLNSSESYLIEPGGILASAHLEIWRGYLNTYSGNYNLAEKLLAEQISRLKAWGDNNQREPRWAAMLARAYNCLGYLYDRQTRPYRAIEAYKKAIQLWQALKLQVEEATTLNNIAFDRGKTGAFAAAFEDARSGLQLREQIGPRAPVGLSLNTLASIELSSNELTAARRDAQHALDIFNRINSPRGRGLAFTVLAEANRRASQLITSLQQGTSVTMLELASEYAEAAAAIFTKDVDEPARRMEALREKGRIYRAWARVRYERPLLISEKEAKHGKALAEKLTHLSEQAFKLAAAQVLDDRFSQIELLLDQAFLRYYVALYQNSGMLQANVTDLEKEYLNQVEQMIPEPYRNLLQIPSVSPRSWHWVQSGILEVLRGHIAFKQRLVQAHDKDSLCVVLEHYLLGLTFHSRFSVHVFQELRIALDQIYETLRELSLLQKKTAYQIVANLEEKHGLQAGKSLMNRFMEDRFGEIDIVEIAF